MEEQDYMKEAERIATILINMWQENGIDGRSFDVLFQQLWNRKYRKMNVFVYVPQIIYQCGYEIIHSNPFELKKIK